MYVAKRLFQEDWGKEQELGIFSGFEMYCLEHCIAMEAFWVNVGFVMWFQVGQKEEGKYCASSSVFSHQIPAEKSWSMKAAINRAHLNYVQDQPVSSSQCCYSENHSVCGALWWQIAKCDKFCRWWMWGIPKCKGLDNLLKSSTFSEGFGLLVWGWGVTLQKKISQTVKWKALLSTA